MRRSGRAGCFPARGCNVSVKTPIPLGIGGILYFADTSLEQGAFTIVPGFQRWGEAWLKGLLHGANPRQQDLYALGPRAIGGRAGDLVMSLPAPFASVSRAGAMKYPANSHWRGKY